MSEQSHNPYGTPPPPPYRHEQPSAPLNAAYASWGRRVAGYLVDSLVAVPLVIVAGVSMVVAMRDVSTGVDGYGTHMGTGTLHAAPMAAAVVFYLLALVCGGWNRWYLGGKTGRSIGRRALGIRLVGQETGQPIGMGMAFVRDLAHALDSISFYVGWLFPLWDARRQTFADKVCNTVVIDEHRA